MLKEECEEGRRLGFDGKQAIHPSQISRIQSSFSPSLSGEPLLQIVRLLPCQVPESSSSFGYRVTRADLTLRFVLLRRFCPRNPSSYSNPRRDEGCRARAQGSVWVGSGRREGYVSSEIRSILFRSSRVQESTELTLSLLSLLSSLS